MAEKNENKTETKSDNDNTPPAPKMKVDLNVGPRTWGQRAEIVGLGALGTAAGVGLAKLGERFIVKKATDEGLRHAASFAGDMFKSLFG